MKMFIYVSDSLRHMKVFVTSQCFYIVTFKAFYKSVYTIVTVNSHA